MPGAAPRVLLVTGKGGVGKTTTAAALAVEAARAGRRTLVVSTDAAASLGDTLGVELPTAASWRDATPVEPGLEATAVDAQTGVEASWPTVHGYLLELLDGVGVDPVLAEELTTLPGAAEVTALLALGHQARSGRYDLVVVDCAPTADTLRLLALPEVLGWHLDRLLPAQRRLLTALRPAAAAAAGIAMPGPEVLGVVTAWREQVVAVRALLTSASASVRLVLTPERVVIAEARRLLTSLGLHGYAVDGLVVNRVLPPGRDPWRAGWNAAQHEGLAAIGESFAGIPTRSAPYLAAEPTGPDALAALAAATVLIEGEERPLEHPVEPSGPRVEAVGLDFVLTLRLPLARSADVALARRDDDLLVTVGADRRVVALPAVLRRCVVKNASVGQGELRVRFERDEEVWPRAR
ncbi:MAG TPA: ArsA family ATPase [Dermatophilaceae bacterium]|nr:ArsA family ATPase [Dermatophilaceae bacterium]